MGKQSGVFRKLIVFMCKVRGVKNEDRQKSRPCSATSDFYYKTPTEHLDSEVNVVRTRDTTERGDAFLEPYMQGLPPDFATNNLPSHQSAPSSPLQNDDSTNHNAVNNIADLARFRLLDIDGSADSLDQDLESTSASSDDGDGDGESGSDAPCDISLLERLIRSHPVWFLPGIQRAGAFHLLQGKEEGNFVVRQSSQPETMAISVRLPMGKGPYIEHYLIQSTDGQLSLESSDNRFDSIPALVSHYCQCCDELPVALSLPRAMRDASNRQQLSSLALLGQEFWRYPMANPRPVASQADRQSPPSTGSSLSSLGSGNNNQHSAEPIVLNLAPLGEAHSLMTTFKGSSPNSPTSPTDSQSGIFVAPQRARPTPPNTLSLVCAASSPPNSALALRTPPPPPPRWAKPSPTPQGSTPQGQNFTVTTTVTFSTNHTPSPLAQVEPARTPLVMSPSPASTPSTDARAARRKQRHLRESRHYQESDILDSPTTYYRSSVADKVSDYEDVWGPDLTTFKPHPPPSVPTPSPEERRSPPDLLMERVSTPVQDAVYKESSRNHLGLVINTSPTSPSPLATTPPPAKQGSPFYAEPADALLRRRPNFRQPSRNRHSDVWPANHSAALLSRIDSSEELTNQGLSSSMDNLAALRSSRNTGKPRAKPVQPPQIRPTKPMTDASWAVDSSWEFIGKEGEEDDDEEDEDEYRDERDMRFPSLEQQETTLDEFPPGKITVQELIAQRFPALRLSPDIMPTSTDMSRATLGSRISSYDNVDRRNARNSQLSDSDETATLFSEPWDSSCWDQLIANNLSQETAAAGASHIARNKSFKERLDPLLSPPRLQALRNRDAGGTGASIRAYALHLAGDKSTTFAQNVDNFIACTRDSREISPQVVMRNMRQFMSGMKNYLVKHGEREFEKEVEKERMKLKATEFLNLDAILEGVMHKLVVRPLKEHLYKLFVDEYTKNGGIQLLADNMEYARTKTLVELGIRAKIVPPSEPSLETICHYLTTLQQVDSPLEKLENLLTSISAIFNSVKCSNQGRGCVTLGADDFLPLFVWVLVQSNMVAAEIEAEYMWGLLHPSLLSGEGGYYLTTLSSAVHVLKNLRACNEEHSLDWASGSLTEFRSVLKIVVPDEMHGSIITKTLPVRPNMTTRDVSKIIAHKVRITNPQDYGLFKLVDGEETLLSDGECPQDVKGNMSQGGKHVMFAYKRIDAKIAWPRTSSPQ